jgi:hypothetical protein
VTGRLVVIAILLLSVLSTAWFTYSDLMLARQATTLKHREKVRLCNAQGNLYADGVCQRLYINLNRRL